MTVKTLAPATDDHVDYIAGRMRAPDAAEAWAAARMSPYDALVHSMQASRDPMTGLADRRPVCMFGIAQVTPLSDWGVPWMLATDEIEDHARVLVLGSRRYMQVARERYARLENYVDARNVKAVKWLGWLGFEVDPAAPFGIEGLPFHRFHWEAS